jgi:hypothetical protein
MLAIQLAWKKELVYQITNCGPMSPIGVDRFGIAGCKFP